MVHNLWQNQANMINTRTIRGALMKSFFSKWNIAGRRFYFFCYTLIFLVLSAIVFSPYMQNGKSFIWKPDGLTQHFNSLIYFRNWMLSILRSLVTEHRLSIPLWDSTIGYGSDILTTLHYYVIGDPLNLLSLLVPARYLEGIYDFLVLLRLYLAGVTFSCYCFRMKRQGMAALAGSLIYVFSGYGIVLSPVHPYFINPMIYLPLLLIGIERVLHKEKGHLLIAITALSSISNFYFFYMLVILTVIYFIIRFCTMKHLNWKKELFSSLGKTLFFSLTGTGISAILLLPILLQFFSDARSNTSLSYSPIYRWDYYEQLFDQFISLSYSSHWTYLCFATPALLCVFLLFLKKKRYRALKIGFLFLTALLLLPAAGSFLNGFSYVANRWDFGYSFLVAFITAFLWPELFSLNSKEKCWLFLLFLLYGTLLFLLPDSGSDHAFFSLFLLLLTLFFLTELLPYTRKFPLGAQSCLLLFISINICANSIFYYQNNMENHLSRFVDKGEGLSSLTHSASGMVNLFLADPNEFCRYAQDMVPVRNDTLTQKANSIHYYWSLSNGAITQFFNELAMPFEERSFKYDNLDNRAQLHSLAGVRWYVQYDQNNYLPYPFQDVEVFDYSNDLYYVSETENYLPFGYTSANLISRKTYNSLSYLQRQQALLQGIVCESMPANAKEAPQLSFQEQPSPLAISYGSDIYEQDGIYYAMTDGAELTLIFESLPKSETYLLLEGLEAHSLSDWEFYTQEPTAQFFEEERTNLNAYERRQKKKDNFYAPNVARFPITCTSELLKTTFCYYNSLTESSYDRSDFLINLGYSSEGQYTATITLPYQGTYSFQDISIISLPLEQLSEQIATLSQEHLENVSFTTNRITGTITVSDSKYLCLSIPYSKGWKAYVDGRPVPLCQANTMYMALPLESGTQSIELRYTTPGLIPGLLITAGGLIIWLLYFLFERKKRNAPHAKEA